MSEAAPVLLPVYYEELTSTQRPRNSTLAPVTSGGDLRGNETSGEDVGELALVTTFITINVFTVVCPCRQQLRELCKIVTQVTRTWTA